MDTGPRFGDWPQFLDDSLNRHRNSSMKTHFCGLDTNEARIKYILESDFLQKADWLKRYFDECENEPTGSATHKTSTKAECHRKEGNAKFQQKLYQQALRCYNEAVIHAPSEGSGQGEMALSLGNRSAALCHLQHFKESLSDIQLAIKHGYPKHLLYKLFQRRALCYKQLQDTRQAIEGLTEARVSVETDTHMDVKKKERLLKEITCGLENIKSEATCDNSNHVADAGVEMVPPESTPTPVYGWNKHVLQASAAVVIATTEDMGRHIVVTRHVKAGDVLIIDEPFAAVLLPEYYGIHCHHCFTPLLVVVPCHRCTHVRYCSEACRKESWDIYHHVECHYSDLLLSVGIAHLSLRVILTAGLKFLNDFRMKISDFPRDANGRLTGFNERGTYERQYLATFALQDHSEDFHSDDLFQYSLTATLLLSCLQDSVCDVIDPVYMGGLLLTHICQLVCNAHAITKVEVGGDDVDGSSLVSTTRQVRIATAIYATTSLTNHSCQPNVILGFDKKVLVVRATEDIPPGGGVYVSYGPTNARMGWAERQQRLREQYFFTCLCKACKTGDRMEELSSAVKCPHCSGPLDDKQPKSTCLKCQRVTDTTNQRKLLTQADSEFVAGLQQLEKNNITGAIKSFHKCLDVRKAVLSGRQRSLGEVWDVLARCYAMQGSYRESAKYLEHSIANTETIYGSSSVELAHELQKLAEILFHCDGRALDAVQTTDRAVELFTLNYGSGCEAVTELRQLKACLVQGSVQQ